MRCPEAVVSGSPTGLFPSGGPLLGCQGPVDHPHRIAADAHRFELLPPRPALARSERASHLVPLLDHPPVGAVWQPVELLHDPRKANSRRPGRGVLGDAELRGEHASMERRAIVHALTCIEIDAIDLARGKVPPIAPRGRAPCRWPRGSRRGRRRTYCQRRRATRCGSRSRSRAAATPPRRPAGRGRRSSLPYAAASARRIRRTAPGRRATAHRHARCQSPARMR